jgi:hypothetical protein
MSAHLLGFKREFPNFPIALNNPTEIHSLTKVIAMDDHQKDIAIIEASALLVTLIFIILSFYSSNYALYYTMLCSSNPKGCVWPPWLTSLSALVTILEPYTYLIGFFFVVAAFAATLHLFEIGSGWLLAGLQKVEFLFFAMGLILLAIMFVSNAPRDMYTFAWIAIATSCMIVVPLLYAYHGRHASISEPT